MTIKIRGQPRAANQKFNISKLDKALELYDLAVLYQHQAGACINMPDKHNSHMRCQILQHRPMLKTSWQANSKRLHRTRESAPHQQHQVGQIQIQSERLSLKEAKVCLAIWYNMTIFNQPSPSRQPSMVSCAMSSIFVSLKGCPIYSDTLPTTLYQLIADTQPTHCNDSHTDADRISQLPKQRATTTAMLSMSCVCSSFYSMSELVCTDRQSTACPVVQMN